MSKKSSFGQVTLSQAMAIVSYLSTHATRISEITVTVNIADVSFSENMPTSFLYRDSLKASVERRLKAIAKNDIIKVMITHNSEGTAYDFYNFI